MHAVLVLSAEGVAISNYWPVPEDDVPELMRRIRAEHADARVLIDGQLAGVATSTPTNPEVAVIPTPMEPDDLGQTITGVKLAHAMLWTTFDRAASVQAWMLQQANVFTKDLLENNRKLADQASAMQARFQDAMQRIDLMETEKKLIEHDLMARRLSRHAVAQNRAEEQANRPKEPADTGWIDELICGVSSFFNAARQPPKDYDKN